MGFQTTAYERLRIDDQMLKHSAVKDMFELSSEECGYLVEQADPGLRLNLLFLDVWARLHLRSEALDDVRENVLGTVQVLAG